MQMCSDYILLEDTNQSREESQQGELSCTYSTRFLGIFFFLPGSLTSGTCFGLATHNINTKISGLPDVLQNILFVKYFKVLQMSRNLYCCVLLTRNQQELFHGQLHHHQLTLGGFCRVVHERHVGLTRSCLSAQMTFSGHIGWKFAGNISQLWVPWSLPALLEDI